MIFRRNDNRLLISDLEGLRRLNSNYVAIYMLNSPNLIAISNFITICLSFVLSWSNILSGNPD